MLVDNVAVPLSAAQGIPRTKERERQRCKSRLKEHQWKHSNNQLTFKHFTVLGDLSKIFLVYKGFGILLVLAHISMTLHLPSMVRI